MKKKQFLTESDRKQILADTEKAILESFANTFNKIKRADENEINDINLEPQTKDVAYYIKKALEVESEYDFIVDNIGNLSSRYSRKKVIDFTATDKIYVSDEDGEYTLLLKISVEHEEDEDGAGASGENFFGFVDVYMEDENNPLYGIKDENLLVKWVNNAFGVEALPQEIVSKLDPETLKKLEILFKVFVDSVKDDANPDY